MRQVVLFLATFYAFLVGLSLANEGKIWLLCNC